MPMFCCKSYKFECCCGELGSSASSFSPHCLGTLEKNYVKSKTSPGTQGSVSVCLGRRSKAQPHEVTREAKIMAETALSILAPACDYLQLQVAQNYLWSLKHLPFYFIPRTNSFLETSLRDKGTTTKNESPRYFSCGEGGVSQQASMIFIFIFLNVSCLSPLLYP